MLDTFQACFVSFCFCSTNAIHFRLLFPNFQSSLQCILAPFKACVCGGRELISNSDSCTCRGKLFPGVCNTTHNRLTFCPCLKREMHILLASASCTDLCLLCNSLIVITLILFGFVVFLIQDVSSFFTFLLLHLLLPFFSIMYLPLSLLPRPYPMQPKKLVYSMLYIFIYYIYFYLDLQKSSHHHKLPVKRLLDLVPKRDRESWFGPTLSSLSWTFFKQAILKQMLTDGKFTAHECPLIVQF